MKNNIAILGQGQLAQMMHEAAVDVGVVTTDFPLPGINADGSCSEQVIAEWVHRLQSYDCLTYEIENIPVDLLKAVQKQLPVSPAIGALAVSQDRLKEKQLFTKLDIPTNDFKSIHSLLDLQQAGQSFGFPFLVKARRFGYDGKGQFVIQDENELLKTWKQMEGGTFIAEQFVQFDYEVSQVATRDHHGKIAYYPLVRNEHRGGILRESYVLTDPDEALVSKAQQAVGQFLQHFDYVGTMAMELFVVNGEIVANETAPRVHNSGHWTINGAETSQFANHLKAISGQDVGSVTRKHHYCMMINLIGEDASQADLNLPGIYVKSYGKSIRPNRKIGHINVVAGDIDTFKERVNQVYQVIEATPCLVF